MITINIASILGEATDAFADRATLTMGKENVRIRMNANKECAKVRIDDSIAKNNTALM